MSGASRRVLKIAFYTGILIGYGFLASQSVLAAENGQDWRPTYDLIMRWVNFFILAFLIIKYLKNPLVDFLKTRKEEMAREIRKLEEEKKQAETNSLETRELVQKGEAHIAKIKQKIIEQGEREKQRIIDAAHAQSQYMIEDAKQRVQTQLGQAEQTFKSELVDAAMQLATERLPNELTETDHQALLETYLAQSAAS